MDGLIEYIFANNMKTIEDGGGLEGENVQLRELVSRTAEYAEGDLCSGGTFKAPGSSMSAKLSLYMHLFRLFFECFPPVTPKRTSRSCWSNARSLMWHATTRLCVPGASCMLTRLCMHVTLNSLMFISLNYSRLVKAKKAPTEKAAPKQAAVKLNERRKKLKKPDPEEPNEDEPQEKPKKKRKTGKEPEPPKRKRAKK